MKKHSTAAHEKPGIFNFFMKIIHYFNHSIVSLNSSKFFAGLIIILINIGSKFITIQFSKSTEEYLKYTISKQILIFSMAWLGTRDIYTAFGMTAVLTILSDYLFNEDSALCIIPEKYRVLKTMKAPTSIDEVITDEQVNVANAIIEKARQQKAVQHNRLIFMRNFY